MKVLMHGQVAPAELRNCSLALGNFDGVHLGHQAVILSARDHLEGQPTAVATFDPHPSRLFQPDTPPFVLTTIRQRLDLFEELGVDMAIVIPFDQQTAGMSAAEFAQTWLVDRIGASHVVTGEDFTFGRKRSGNAKVLAELGRELGFTSEWLAPVGDNLGLPVSSTRIRAHLEQGEMAEATALLSRPFSIRGKVVHGRKIGRTIGVPTANLELGDYLRPRYGVYAVQVRLPDGSVQKGVANIGISPMFEPPVELLEVWILDWSGDLYDQEVEVSLIEFLRPELKLDGLDALKAQINQDARDARRVLQALL